MEQTQNLEFVVKSHRCPYCHDDVGPEDCVVCQDCLTRHHPECWEEGLRCSSCSSENKMVSSTKRQNAPSYKPDEIVPEIDDEGRVPEEKQCSREGCELRGAMYAHYSDDRLCLVHARKFDRKINLFRGALGFLLFAFVFFLISFLYPGLLGPMIILGVSYIIFVALMS